MRPLTERYAAMPNQNFFRVIRFFRVSRATDFARDAADHIFARGLLARFVRDRRAAEFEEEEVFNDCRATENYSRSRFDS